MEHLKTMIIPRESPCQSYLRLELTFLFERSEIPKLPELHRNLGPVQTKKVVRVYA